MTIIISMKSVQDLIEVYEDKITITPKGVLGFMNKGLKGTKDIPFSSITAIQFKKGGLTSGYLQFTLMGGNESRGGIMAATKDENSFVFYQKQNKEAEEIKQYIETRIKEIQKPILPIGGSVSLSDELEKLANLKNQGILTEDEFLEAKKKLIN